MNSTHNSTLPLGQGITTILLEEIKRGKVPLKNCATHFPNYKKGII